MALRILLLFTGLFILTSTSQAQQTLTETITVDGVPRQYIVYIPAMYDASVPTPLLFNFHGFTQQASNHLATSAMRPVADTAGFILVYPQGSLFFGNPHWNVGAWTNGSTANDLGFTAAMIDTLAAAYNIDLNRVYSCGYSNGGYFSFELACQLSDRIAAIGSVGGKMSLETLAECNPTHPMPVVTIHGTADNVVAYSTAGPVNSTTVDETNLYWVGHNSLEPTPTITDVPNTDTSDGSTVEYFAYRSATDCVAVDHYKVNGGGHDWVGVRGNMDIDASSVIWNFVSKYDLNGLINCSPSSSISETAFAKTLHLYPNPTHGILTIDSDLNEVTDCSIYSMTGQLLATRKVGPSKTTIDISDLAAGVYLVVVKDKKGRLVKG